MRADEVQVGDMLAGGERVISVKQTGNGVDVRTRVGKGPVIRHRYTLTAIVPTPGNPHPSQHEKGHPWAQGRFIPRRYAGETPN